MKFGFILDRRTDISFGIELPSAYSLTDLEILVLRIHSKLVVETYKVKYIKMNNLNIINHNDSNNINANHLYNIGIII